MDIINIYSEFIYIYVYHIFAKSRGGLESDFSKKLVTVIFSIWEK